MQDPFARRCGLALRFEEGWGPPTALRDALIEAAGSTGSMNNLLHRFYTGEFPRARIAAFAPLVDELALAGDAVARDILNDAAQSLAAIAAAVRGQLFAPAEIVTICHVGCVFEQDASNVSGCWWSCTMGVGPRLRKFPPAARALIKAYRLAGVDCALENVPS